MTQKLLDRELAGRLLSKKLEDYADSNSVVFGIPRGGVCVAAEISQALALPLEAIFCRRINHPADHHRSIGSVSTKDVCIHNCSHTIPQDYIAHQIALLRNAVGYEREYFYGGRTPAAVHYKTVILATDVLATSDSILACIRELKRQEPLKLIVAVPVVSAEAARIIRSEADDIVYLRIEPFIRSAKDYYIHFPDITDEKVKELLESGKKYSGSSYQFF